MIDLSFFVDVRHKAPVSARLSWTDLCEYLETVSRDVAHPASKTETACFSPARYREGSSRGLEGALDWTMAAVDLDDKAGGGWRFEDAAEFCDALGLANVVYTTSSSTPDQHRLRVLAPLSRRVEKGEFAAFWYALNQLFGGDVDSQTKDISRMFVEPRAWTGADNRFSAVREGLAIDPDEIMTRYPAPPLAPVASLPARLVNRPAGALSWADSNALEDSRIVPASALERALMAPQGGRMIAFLTSCAMSAFARKFEITVHDLVNLGEALSARLGRSAHNLLHDASNALRFAEARVASNYVQKLRRHQAALFGSRCSVTMGGHSD